MKNLFFLLCIAFLALVCISCNDSQDLIELETAIEQQTMLYDHSEQERVKTAPHSLADTLVNISEYAGQGDLRADHPDDVNGQQDLQIICFPPNSDYFLSEASSQINPKFMAIRVKNCYAGKQTAILFNPLGKNPNEYASESYQVEWLTSYGKLIHKGNRLTCYSGEEPITIRLVNLATKAVGHVKFVPTPYHPTK